MNLIKSVKLSKIGRLDQGLNQVACSRVRYANHYTKVSSVLV